MRNRFCGQLNRRAMTAGLMAAAGAGLMAPWARAQNMTALLRAEGRYYPVYSGALRVSPDPLSTQLLAFWQSTVGEERAAFHTISALNDPATIDAKSLEGFRTKDALADIVERARDRRIVILNEAHYSARCRAFAETVALVLAGLGFNLLAAEAFPNRPESHWLAGVDAGAPVTTAEGVYTVDPCFGEFIRGARAAGYRLAAYEARDGQKASSDASQTEQINARDGGQAANLAAAFNAVPGARMLVYCGFEHVDKTGSGEVQRLAARLKALTGHDPLCVSQAYGLGAPDPADTDPNTRIVLDTFAPDGSVTISDAAGRPLDWVFAPGGVDVAVYHPAAREIGGRAGWLATAPGRKQVEADLPGGASGDGVLQAFHAAEPVNSVPADQCLVKAGEVSATLFLKPGTYRIMLDRLDGRQEMPALTV